MSETFNGFIIESSSKPIITILEEIRLYYMVRLRTKREEIEKGNLDIALRMLLKFNKNYKYSNIGILFTMG